MWFCMDSNKRNIDINQIIKKGQKNANEMHGGKAYAPIGKIISLAYTKVKE